MDLRSYVKEVERNYREGQNIFRRRTVGYLLQRIAELEKEHNQQALPNQSNALFSKRVEISRVASEWCSSRNIPLHPFNIVTALESLGFLKEE